MNVEDKDYMQVYKEHWKELVAPNGELVLDLVARELYDYGVLLDSVPGVYMHVTGDRISKPHTLSGAVISEADDYSTKLFNEQMVDELKIIKDKVYDAVRNQSMEQLEKFFDEQEKEYKRLAL